MDPIITVATIGAFVTLIAGLISYLGSRSQVAFVERLQAEVTRQDLQLQRQGARIEALEKSDGEKDARIMVLTTWGMHTTESVPRTPPPWREGT